MRLLKSVRGYIISGVVGAALMFGLQAGASGLLDGSKVAGTKDVTYNGKEIGKAAIINNSSYLPVRAISDAVGLQIDLSGGTINLSQSEPSASSGTSDQLSDDERDKQIKIASIQQQISKIDKSISDAKAQLEIDQKRLDAMLNDPNAKESIPMYQRPVDAAKAQIADLEKQKADLEAQLKALQGQ